MGWEGGRFGIGVSVRVAVAEGVKVLVGVAVSVVVGTGVLVGVRVGVSVAVEVGGWKIVLNPGTNANKIAATSPMPMMAGKKPL